MRSAILLILCAAVLGVASPANAAPSWAAPQIAAVVAAGVLGPSAVSFRPDELLTRGELHAGILALGRPHAEPLDPGRVVTIRELDAQLVASVGLLPAARSIRLSARDAGLTPRDSLGTETVARLLGLRIDHPSSREHLERAPHEPASRAEAAYSLARLLVLDPLRVAAIDQTARAFRLPLLDDWQRPVLSRALRLVGSPYVFAGVSEKPQTVWSSSPGGLVAAPGGFDCSGFAWRIFKLGPYPGAPLLQSVLEGRTSYAMSGEVPKQKRVARHALRPADLVFFGSRGRASRPAEIGHMGIYVGNGWLVHASSAGVALRPLDGWYAERFAWGRSPLAEAGLSL